MPNFDADFDYLFLLGIDPADALRAPASMVEGIKVKKKEWTSQALNPLYQQGARANLERAREFDALLLEPAALTAYVNHIKQKRISSRVEHEVAIGLLIALAGGGKKQLTAKQRDLIAKEAKAEGIHESVLNDILRLRAVAIVDATAASPAGEKPKLPLQSPALDSTIMNEIHGWLKILDKRSLYEMLDIPNTTPPSRIASTAQLLFAHWSKVLPKTNTSTAWEKTLQSSLTYLKDPESKAKYDRALFNLRIHRLVSRVDLVLAGTKFGAHEQGELVRIGVEDFGFSADLVDQCIAARMADKGMTFESRAKVAVQIQGKLRCRRCGALNDTKTPQCRECGSSLHRKCENPACSVETMPVNAKACPSCTLPVSRGVQYRTLLRLADAFLETGSFHAALSACQLASQILAGPAVDERLARASRIRELSASAKMQAAAQAWTAASATLKELLKAAPRLSLQNVPTLEKITQFLADIHDKIRTVPSDEDPVEAAKTYLGALKRWSDCEEAYQKLRAIGMKLESSGDIRRAWQVSCKLQEVRPDDQVVRSLVARLEPEARRLELLEADRKKAVADYAAALSDHRLFAAERLLEVIQTLSSSNGLPSTVDELRRRLSEIRRELTDIKLAVSDPTRREAVVDRYLDLLRRCRDCREAHIGLQSAPIEPPAQPVGLALRREGNRRVLSWRPGPGKTPTSYVVQRSISRPGSRQVDPPFQTFYEGESLHVNDDEVAHGGVVIRYMIHSVSRGKIEVDGTVVRTFDVASASTPFPGVLIWQEPMNFKSIRRGRGLELTWYPPAGARNVLIERWPGGPEDRGLGSTILPTTGPDRLLDEALDEKMVYTYRLSCVFDGPDGEFRTPGVMLTDGIAATNGRVHEPLVDLGSASGRNS